MIERYAKGDQVPLSWFRTENMHPLRFGRDVESQVMDGKRHVWVSSHEDDDESAIIGKAIENGETPTMVGTPEICIYAWTREEHSARSASEGSTKPEAVE